jgi:hypothetical protein
MDNTNLDNTNPYSNINNQTNYASSSLTEPNSDAINPETINPETINTDPTSTETTSNTINSTELTSTEPDSPIYKLLLKIHKYALLFIYKIVDILLLPKQILLFSTSPTIKNGLITVMFLIICSSIYYGVYSLLNHEDPINKCPQNTRQQLQNSYIYDQIIEFYTQTCIIFNITPPSIPVPVKEKPVATLTPKQTTEQATAQANAKLQREQNTKMVIVQILGWILLIYLVIIISNPTNNENSVVNSDSILTTFFR